MGKKIFFSLLNAVLLTMCILSCVFRWYIPGWICLALAVGWFGYQNIVFCLKESVLGLIAAATFVVLCVAGWLPIALTGIGNLEVFQILVIFGSIASGMTIPFYFYK